MNLYQLILFILWTALTYKIGFWAGEKRKQECQHKWEDLVLIGYRELKVMCNNCEETLLDEEENGRRKKGIDAIKRTAKKLDEYEN